MRNSGQDLIQGFIPVFSGNTVENAPILQSLKNGNAVIDSTCSLIAAVLCTEPVINSIYPKPPLPADLDGKWNLAATQQAVDGLFRNTHLAGQFPDSYEKLVHTCPFLSMFGKDGILYTFAKGQSREKWQ